MPEHNTPNGSHPWTEYRLLVIKELESHGETLNRIDRRISKLEIDINTLKVKAAFIGAIAGAVLAGLVQLLMSAV